MVQAGSGAPNAARLAELESRDTGHPIRDTTGLDVPRTVLGFRYFAGMADKISRASATADRTPAGPESGTWT